MTFVLTSVSYYLTLIFSHFSMDFSVYLWWQKKKICFLREEFLKTKSIYLYLENSNMLTIYGRILKLMVSLLILKGNSVLGHAKTLSHIFKQNLQ